MNNELSTEVKAQEIHERAVGFYKISEQYGYKFLMEIKTIRDEKLFEELGFKNFEDYTLNNFNYSRNTINERIQTAEAFGEEYNRARGSLGHRKMKGLATMPEEQRKYVMENGIETDEGNKTIDEATTREIEKYKKQLKQRDEEKAQMQSQLELARKSEQTAIKQLEDEQDKVPETKTEYKEVIPDKVKKKLEQFENDKKLLEQKEKENRDIRKQLREQRENLQKQQETSNKEEYWDVLTDDQIISRQRVYAETNVLEIKEHTDEFLNKVSVNTFRDAAIAKSSQRTKNMIYESSEEVIAWAKSIQQKLNSNSFAEDASYREDV